VSVTAVNIKKTFFWAVITKRVVEIYRRIGGKYYLYLLKKSGLSYILVMEEQVSAKLRYLSTGLRGATCQKFQFFNGLLCLFISEETKITKGVS
jgi:hypothetical protein